MSSTRAENRRALRATQKVADYKKSGFIDRAVYQPFAASQRTDRRGFDINGNPMPSGPFTADELHQRAVDRRDTRKAIEKLVADQAKATNEASKERKADAKALRRSRYLAGFGMLQPVHHMHSAARFRLAAANLPIAA